MLWKEGLRKHGHPGQGRGRLPAGYELSRSDDEVDSRRVRRSVATELSEDLAFPKHLLSVNNHYALASSNEKALSGYPDRARLKTAASYFPTWCRSIIGASELNFSVRNGLRWILTAITALFVHRRRFTISCSISYEKDNLAFTHLPLASTEGLASVA